MNEKVEGLATLLAVPITTPTSQAEHP